MTTLPFAEYARWYDAFNADKDYAAESAYVLRRVQRWKPSPSSWLDLGCGTGNHLPHLAAHGISVEGVDASAAMVEMARGRHPDIPFHVGSIQKTALRGGRDVVSMLFHVMSYQTTDDAIRGAFQSAEAHLATDGILAFDFWHTEAILRDPPTTRVRQAVIDGRTLFRSSHPTENRAARRVDVRFEFRWDSPDGQLQHEEVHSMRHFTADELGTFLQGTGLRTLCCEGWSRGVPLAAGDWYGFICAGKSG